MQVLHNIDVFIFRFKKQFDKGLVEKNLLLLGYKIDLLEINFSFLSFNVRLCALTEFFLKILFLERMTINW